MQAVIRRLTNVRQKHAAEQDSELARVRSIGCRAAEESGRTPKVAYSQG